ncbi:MAG: bifunctional adenosylcobinamide kinase/adenosylcobinamide-phosphate guanylyltransferase [Parvularculales bacterium]
MLPPVTLVLGGTRSGKSRYAEDLVRSASGRPTYIATAEALDEEMAERITKHKIRRGEGWQMIEEPLEITQALGRLTPESEVVLVDCLTVWLANIMGAERDVVQESAALVAQVQRLNVPVVLVSNETGLGIVPDNAMARAFRDHGGVLAQKIAAIAQSVVLMIAGLPLHLKTTSHEML